METLIEIVKAISPDTQLVLALCVFALIIVISVSREARRGICDFLDALARLLTRRPKPPQPPEDPPTQDTEE